MSADSRPAAGAPVYPIPVSDGGYRVQLPMYAGPADLLLYLVRRSEVDVCEVPLSQLTAQFLAWLDVLQQIDFDSVGDFVVVASTLVEMKSRQVLPGPEEADDAPAEETTADGQTAALVAQLLQYRRYREAGRELELRAARWQERYPRLSSERPEAGKDHSADRIKEVELWDLVSALSRVLKRQVADEHSSIKYDDTPISVHIERVAQRVKEEGRASFSSFFRDEAVRVRIVSVFLAVLELLRHHSYRAEQPEEFGEIWILPPLTEEEAATHSDEAPVQSESSAGETAPAPTAPSVFPPAAAADSPVMASDSQPEPEAAEAGSVKPAGSVESEGPPEQEAGPADSQLTHSSEDPPAEEPDSELLNSEQPGAENMAGNDGSPEGTEIEEGDEGSSAGRSAA
ncbi:MAG: segregation/condensation protein A [Planctomycetaceae bacterium]|nr:segregation/condensation protein A [Planctomycetaceae bacterium]